MRFAALFLAALLLAPPSGAVQGSFALQEVQAVGWTSTMPLTVSSDDVIQGLICTVEYDGRMLEFQGVDLAPGLDPPWTIERVNDNQQNTCPVEWPLRRLSVLAACDRLDDGVAGTRQVLLFRFRSKVCGRHWIALPVCTVPTYVELNHAHTPSGLLLMPVAPYSNLLLSGGAVLQDCGTVAVLPERWEAVKALYR